MKITNKIRYRSMRRSAPLVQYFRYLRGQHYQNGTYNPFGLPRVIAKRIEEQWNENFKVFNHNCRMASIRVIEGEKHESNHLEKIDLRK